MSWAKSRRLTGRVLSNRACRRPSLERRSSLPEATKANVKGNVFDGLHEQQPVDDPGVMVPILADYFDQLRWRTLPTYFGVRLDAALRPVEGELERAAREEVAMIQVDPTS